MCGYVVGLVRNTKSIFQYNQLGDVSIDRHASAIKLLNVQKNINWFTVHGKILAQEKLANLTNHELFPKIFLAKILQIH